MSDGGRMERRAMRQQALDIAAEWPAARVARLSPAERAVFESRANRAELQELCDVAVGWLVRAEAEIASGRIVAAVPLLAEARRAVNRVRAECGQ